MLDATGRQVREQLAAVLQQGRLLRIGGVLAGDAPDATAGSIHMTSQT